MKKKILLLLSLFMLVGCSSNKNAYFSTEAVYDEAGTTDAYYSLDELKTYDTGTLETSDSDTLYENKIIYTAHIDIETKDFDKTVEVLNSKIEEYEGYVIDKTINRYGENKQYIDGYYEIRIPSAKYKEFIANKDEIGVVSSINESTDDVTEEYIDLTARLENLKLEEESIQKLYDRATEMSDILEIESRLSDVRGDIESYESKIKYYDTLTSYATINISISQVNVYTANKSFIEKVGDMFKDSFENFKDVLEGLLEACIYALPFVCVFAIIFVVIYKTVKKKKKEVKECENLEK